MAVKTNAKVFISLYSASKVNEKSGYIINEIFLALWTKTRLLLPITESLSQLIVVVVVSCIYT